MAQFFVDYGSPVTNSLGGIADVMIQRRQLDQQAATNALARQLQQMQIGEMQRKLKEQEDLQNMLAGIPSQVDNPLYKVQGQIEDKIADTYGQEWRDIQKARETGVPRNLTAGAAWEGVRAPFENALGVLGEQPRMQAVDPELLNFRRMQAARDFYSTKNPDKATEIGTQLDTIAKNRISIYQGLVDKNPARAELVNKQAAADPILSSMYPGMTFEPKTEFQVVPEGSTLVSRVGGDITPVITGTKKPEKPEPMIDLKTNKEAMVTPSMFNSDPARYAPRPQKPLVQVSTGGKAELKGLEKIAEGMPALREGALAAKSGLGVLSEMKQLASTGAAGLSGAMKATLAPIFDAAGVDIKNMNDANKYQLLATTLKGPMRVDIVGPGPVTEYEQRLLTAATGGGSNAKQAIMDLLTYYESKARGKVDEHNRVVKTLRGKKDMSDLADFYPEISIGGTVPSTITSAPPRR